MCADLLRKRRMNAGSMLCPNVANVSNALPATHCELGKAAIYEGQQWSNSAHECSSQKGVTFRISAPAGQAMLELGQTMLTAVQLQ